MQQESVFAMEILLGNGDEVDDAQMPTIILDCAILHPATP
jgi:hypothetical protein